ALAIAVSALRQKEVNHMLVGAVDLAGDIRNVLTTDALRPFSRQGVIRPFDRAADGSLPGEGATAVVLRRLEDALAAGDRIYAVIRGIGQAAADAVDTAAASADTYGRSLKRAFQEAAVSPATVGYIETHGSGHPAEDLIECEALHRFFPDQREDPCALGSVKATIGHTGAAAGLASMVKTALCLYQELLPPLVNFTAPAADWNAAAFHIPVQAQYWPRNRAEGPRRACVAAMTLDGNCFHAVLEGRDPPSSGRVRAQVDRERKRPLGVGDPGLFVVEGNDPRELQAGLAVLEAYFRREHAPGTPLEQTARSWYRQHRPDPHRQLAVCLVADAPTTLEKGIRAAARAVGSQTAGRILGPGGFAHSPQPLGPSGETAFVYPGSGNHYVGMGRGIGVRWPEVLRGMDARTDQLKTQMVPRHIVPWRSSWTPGWESLAQGDLAADPLNMIFGQVVYGGIVTELVRRFDLCPAAVIGYSLGESTAYFATGAWTDRGEMLRRMQRTDLFSAQLAGACHAARKAWGIPAGEAFDWCAAVVNRPAPALREMLRHRPTARLLIVNTPD
ncbi:MAG: hypothetical protein MUP74_01570, partial [Desulfobacterales bacterium]|nr:hypothetical protein [Desulfobacterales bacterium]